MEADFQQSFQYVAQRSREIERPNFDLAKVDPLIDELERQFTLLKARATEPQDKHFAKAAELQKQIRTDPKYSGALSFEDDLPATNPLLPSESFAEPAVRIKEMNRGS